MPCLSCRNWRLVVSSKPEGECLVLAISSRAVVSPGSPQPWVQRVREGSIVVFEGSHLCSVSESALKPHGDPQSLSLGCGGCYERYTQTYPGGSLASPPVCSLGLLPTGLSVQPTHAHGPCGHCYVSTDPPVPLADSSDIPFSVLHLPPACVPPSPDPH